jgi:tetratricopeptide (TPR) repeat protein
MAICQLMKKRTLKLIPAFLFIILFYNVSAATAWQDSIRSRHLKRAEKLYEKFEFKRALRQCKRKIDKHDLDNNSYALQLLADIYYANGEFENARDTYYQALKVLDGLGSQSQTIQQNIVRSKLRMEQANNRSIGSTDFNQEVEQGLIVLDDTLKISRLDSMVRYPECDQNKDPMTVDDCLHYYINDLITYNFNKKLRSLLSRKRYGFIGGRFTINKNGTVSNIEIFSHHPQFELEAIRILKGMPLLEPAMFNGEPIAVKEFLHVHL